MNSTAGHPAQIPRHMRHRLEESLNAFRVVLLHGARQSGKTTLARLVAAERGGDYASLDDRATLEAALADPLTFLAGLRPPAAVDEIQLGGDRLVRTACCAGPPPPLAPSSTPRTRPVPWRSTAAPSSPTSNGSRPYF